MIDRILNHFVTWRLHYDLSASEQTPVRLKMFFRCLLKGGARSDCEPEGTCGGNYQHLAGALLRAMAHDAIDMGGVGPRICELRTEPRALHQRASRIGCSACGQLLFGCSVRGRLCRSTYLARATQPWTANRSLLNGRWSVVACDGTSRALPRS